MSLDTMADPAQNIYEIAARTGHHDPAFLLRTYGRAYREREGAAREVRG